MPDQTQQKDDDDGIRVSEQERRRLWREANLGREGGDD